MTSKEEVEDNSLPNQIFSDLGSELFTYVPKKGRGFRLDKRSTFPVNATFHRTLQHRLDTGEAWFVPEEFMS